MDTWVASGIGFRCGRCDAIRGRWARALRSPRRPRIAICGDCLDAWEWTGHRCARCWAPVCERSEVGLLVETGAFAHVGCGAALVLGSPISGTLGRLRSRRSLPRGSWWRLFQASVTRTGP
jgi:hypothetical protein